MTIERPMFPPVDPTRRCFLSQSAGVAAGAAILATAAIPSTPAAAAPAGQLRGSVSVPRRSVPLLSPEARFCLDPVFGLIEAHRSARAAHLAAIEEQNRLDLLGDADAAWVAEDPCNAEWDSLDTLIGTAPVTFAGLAAWAAYLDQIRRDEKWMLEDRDDAASTLIVTVVEVVGNLAVMV